MVPLEKERTLTSTLELHPMKSKKHIHSSSFQDSFPVRSCVVTARQKPSRASRVDGIWPPDPLQAQSPWQLKHQFSSTAKHFWCCFVLFSFFSDQLVSSFPLLLHHFLFIFFIFIFHLKSLFLCVCAFHFFSGLFYRFLCFSVLFSCLALL